jgi:hypothetical protein
MKVRLSLSKNEIIDKYLHRLEHLDYSEKRLPLLSSYIRDKVIKLVKSPNIFKLNLPMVNETSNDLYDSTGKFLGVNRLLSIQGNNKSLFDSYQFNFSMKGEDQEYNVQTVGDFFLKSHSHWSIDNLAIERKTLKTQTNYRIRIGGNTEYPNLNQNQLDTIERIKKSCFCLNHHLHPMWDEDNSVLYYFCKVCGVLYICECFTSLKFNREAVPKESICHVCRGETPTVEFDYYASAFGKIYMPWIKKNALIKADYNHCSLYDYLRTAENELRKSLGTYRIGERWINETILYHTVKDFLSDRYEVIHHARPKFLEGLEYDVFIPKLKTAIEYDGIQHFNAINIFGGKEGLKKTQERDKKKNKLSMINNINLIRVRKDYSKDTLLAQIDAIIRNV